jgi:hypothetical protein
VAVAALTLGATCSEQYARVAAPYYLAVARLVAQSHPWQVVDLTIGPDASGRGRVVLMTGLVREHRDDPEPAAKVICRLQVASAVESPVIFWTLLLLWPAASVRLRFLYLALGIPIFLCLEAVTSVCQLLNPLAYASAVLTGSDAEPVTLWEHWSRFIESGGRAVLAFCAAVLTVTAVRAAGWGRGQAAPTSSATAPASDS